MTHALLLLLACSDYQFGKKDDTTPPVSDSGPPPTDSTPGDTATTGGDSPVTETGTDTEACPEPALVATPPAIDAACVAEHVDGPIGATLEWSYSRLQYGSLGAPMVGRLVDTDTDGDLDTADVPSVVLVHAEGDIAAHAGDDGRELWLSVGGGALDWGGAAIGDVDGDGWPDVVSIGDEGVTAYDGADGAVLWESGVFTTRAQQAAPAIADLDGDGDVEVIAYDRVFDGRTGVGRWVATEGIGGGYGASLGLPVVVVADLDLDGSLEWVAGNAVYRADGSVLWSTGEEDGYVGVADLDGDPWGEVVTCRQGLATAFDDDGTPLWSATGVGGDQCNPPAIGDLDGDGSPEVVIAGNASLDVLHADGSRYWSDPGLYYPTAVAGVVLYDFDADGWREVVYADPEGVRVYGGDGTLRLDWRHAGQLAGNAYPTVADSDGDGDAEILLGFYGEVGTSGVLALGDPGWPAARSIWNQHAYSVTNINDDGTVPVAPAPNWLTLNTFRAVETEPLFPEGGADLVPLLVETCTVECDAGRLRVVAAVGNAGTVAVPPGMVLRLYAVLGTGRTPVGEAVTDAWIPPGGASAGMVFEVDPALVSDGILEVEVDPDGLVDQCDPSDDVLRIAEGLCP